MRLLLLIVFILSQPAYADRALKLKKMKTEQRVALVIGNNAYKTMQPLDNPVNDARAMRTALKKRGFHVIYKENATKRDMKKLIKKFSKELSRGGVGMYFYAGHGVSVEGRNYLAGIDSVMNDADEIEYEALALDFVVKKMKKAGNRLNIVALDACRNNPFSRSGGGGLAPIGNAKGLFVAYATEAGDVASDNKNGKNGLFTKHLLASINQPGANLGAVFKKARQGVYDESNGKQSPGVYDQTLGEFYFTLPPANSKKDVAAYSASEPEWLTSLKDYPNCALGIGRKEAINPKQESLMTGLMELGFMEYAKIMGMEKTSVDTSEKVIKILGETSNQKVSEKYNWKSVNGDYFSLTCLDSVGIKIEKSQGMIKFYSKVDTTNGVEKISEDFTLSMKDYLNYKHEGQLASQREKINKERPDWVDDPYFSDLDVGRVAHANIIDGQLLNAYVTAVAKGRLELASELNKRVSKMIKKYLANDATVTPDNVKHGVPTKVVTSEVLVGSRVLKLWQDKENKKLYVLVGIFNDKVKDSVTDTVKKSMKSDKALWQKYKKQRDELGR